MPARDPLQEEKRPIETKETYYRDKRDLLGSGFSLTLVLSTQNDLYLAFLLAVICRSSIHARPLVRRAVCVCVCARARARTREYVARAHTLANKWVYVCVCARARAHEWQRYLNACTHVNERVGDVR
jgi:hypothetical protein